MFTLMMIVSLIFPMKGDAMVSSNYNFPTEKMCMDHSEKLEPGKDALIHSLFGKEAQYTKAEFKCIPQIITDGQPV
jgi:hypothetical protein